MSAELPYKRSMPIIIGDEHFRKIFPDMWLLNEELDSLMNQILEGHYLQANPPQSTKGESE